MREMTHITIRFPADARDWLREQARANCTSVNAETIRAVRYCREKLEAEQPGEVAHVSSKLEARA